MNQGHNEYLRNAVLTASPEQLHLMLYDGAIRFTRQGMEGIEQKNWEQAFTGFSRAQKIMLEMLNSLNYDIDRELCTRMAGLYHFIYQKLVEASAHRDVQPARDALKILDYQRETWVMLIDKLRQERAGESESRSESSPQTLEVAETDEEGDAAVSTYGSLSVHG